MADDKALSAALGKLKLTDEFGDPVAVNSFTPLPKERVQIYASAAPVLADDGVTLSVLCKRPDDSMMEHVVHVPKGNPDGAEVILLECKISLEELPPNQFVEYCFVEGGPWALAKASAAAIEHYRAQKFTHWKDMLLCPTCEAAFRRILRQGLITRLFDEHAFPELSEADRIQWEVIDEKTGKTVRLPHQVHALRVWNADLGKYEEVSSRLVGAPGPGEEAQFWAKLLEELAVQHGKEYLDGLMKS